MGNLASQLLLCIMTTFLMSSPYVYVGTLWSVPPVIALHNKDITVLGELLPNSRESASLRFGLAAAITSCNFDVVSRTYGCSIAGGVISVTDSQCQGGSFGEVLVAMGSTHDPHGYLSAVSDKGTGYVESIERMSPRTRFYQAIFHSEGALPRIVEISPNHWPRPDWKARGRPGAPSSKTQCLAP
jgi:hypothetical protein